MDNQTMTTIHQPGAPKGMSPAQLAMVLAAAGLGINDSTGAVETLPAGRQPVMRERCNPCHPHRHPQAAQVQCYSDERLAVEQLNRLLRPTVAGYPNCEVYDPYKPVDNVLGQTLAEWRAVLAAQLRYYNQEAPVADPSPSTEDVLTSINAAIATQTATLTAIQGDLADQAAAIEAIQTTQTAQGASLDGIETAQTDQAALLTALTDRVQVLEDAQASGGA